MTGVLCTVYGAQVYLYKEKLNEKSVLTLESYPHAPLKKKTELSRSVNR